MIKMLVLDLDNTLLRSDKTISQYTEKILQKAHDVGIKIVFATARPYRAIRHYMQQVNCSTAVYHNGAIALLEGQRAGSSYGIPNKEAIRLVQALQSRYPGKKLSVEIDDKIYANFDVISIWGKSPRDRKILEASTVQTDFSELPEIDADKIIVELNSDSEYVEIQSLLSADLYCLLSDGRTICQIMNRNATKLNAVKQLAMQMGISRSEIAAFGDDYNDLEMIQYSGIGVAMSNAIDEVRQAADAVTVSNNEDGVAKYIMEAILKDY